MLFEIFMVILFNKYLISFACKLCGKLLQICYHYTERVLGGFNVELNSVKCTDTREYEVHSHILNLCHSVNGKVTEMLLKSY